MLTATTFALTSVPTLFLLLSSLFTAPSGINSLTLLPNVSSRYTLPFKATDPERMPEVRALPLPASLDANVELGVDIIPGIELGDDGIDPDNLGIISFNLDRPE